MQFIIKFLNQIDYFFHLEFEISSSFTTNVKRMIDTIQNCSYIYSLLIIECFIIGSFAFPQLLLSHLIALICVLFIRFTFFFKFRYKSLFVACFGLYWLITILVSYELGIIKAFVVCFHGSMISILLHSFFFHIPEKNNYSLHSKNEPVDIPSKNTEKIQHNNKYINLNESQRSL